MYICIFMYLHFTFLSCSILSIFSMFPITAGLFDLLPMHCIFTANFLKACKFLTNLIWKLGSHLLPLFTQLFYLAMHTFHLPAKQKKSAENSLILFTKTSSTRKHKLRKHRNTRNITYWNRELGRTKARKLRDHFFLSVTQLYPVKVEHISFCQRMAVCMLIDTKAECWKGNFIGLFVISIDRRIKQFFFFF